MPIVGYSAALEQFGPTELIRWCQESEKAGFGGVMAADHFHPWLPQQGQSPLVWSWMGALGVSTQRLTFGPGVTVSSYLYHPAIIAIRGRKYPARFMLPPPGQRQPRRPGVCAMASSLPPRPVRS